MELGRDGARKRGNSEEMELGDGIRRRWRARRWGKEWIEG